eukprot:TRINITY_DN16971_c0_g1_i1.p1 TRINITY_DN16971_c0_g1~~TRINITY_DN16971_c0_g1_i1.p1  ORF type:complete len:251 (+),score=47.55 TRINITY_DN16971_c0_g1_i1:2-754(+)
MTIAEELLNEAAHGNVEELKAVLKKDGLDLEVENEDKMTALHLAVANGHLDCVLELVQAGAKIDAPDANGTTPLHAAVGYNYPEIVDFLLANGHESMVKDKEGGTPLMFAALNNRITIAKRLVSSTKKTKELVNAQNSDGYTALHMAVLDSENHEMVEELLKMGVNPMLRDSDNLTAEGLAISNAYMLAGQHLSIACREAQATTCAYCAALKLKSDLKRCSRCHRAVYCSAVCQKAHWPAHKTSCKKPVF